MPCTKIPRPELFRYDQPVFGQLLIEAYFSVGDHVIRNEHFIFYNKWINANQADRYGVEAKLFPDLAQHRNLRIFILFEKAGDQTKGTFSPCLIARQKYRASILNQCCDDRQRVIPVHKPAGCTTLLARQAAKRHALQAGTTAWAKFP